MRAVSLALCVVLVGCDEGGGPGRDAGGAPYDAAVPSATCGSVRLTSYEVGTSGWCEVPHALGVLPLFVRQDGLTTAIAEPWNGGSYGGDPGEACGECWEIDTIAATRVVMVTDLCPIEGNPLCAGAHFHMDLARPAAEALSAGGLDEGAARRVPCPVEGNVHVLINDENFSYLRLAFVNHRVPVRGAVLRPSSDPDGAGLALRRSGGAWEAAGDSPLDEGGDGVTFELTSAQGQTLRSSVVVPAHPARGTTFDLGVQFDDLTPPVGGACDYLPSGVVYSDGWGGIDQVRWMINPWGEAEGGFYGEVTEGCHGGSGSCVRVDRLGQWSGFHLYSRIAFPSDGFSRVTLQLRADRAGQVQVAPSFDGERCEGTLVEVGPEYTAVDIDLATVCGALPQLNAVTIDNPGELLALTFDEVRFEL